jgi:thiaminase/transcriptional activator TenA
VTRAYTRHLLAVAHSGTLGETVAAVLPCYWIYWEVGKRLNQRVPDDPIYATWVQAYANPAFGEHVGQQLRLIDRLAAHASDQERQRMAEHFTQSCRYEFLFWDQAYHRTTWPV